MLNRNEEAVNFIDKALSLAKSPDDWFYVRAGTIYENAGNFEKASQYFHQALALNSSNQSAKEGLTRLDQ